MIKKLILTTAIAAVALCVPATAWGQDAASATAQTLFAYPQAPDTCSTLESRCNYIITHFWDNYDYSRPITDDVAFENTFRDYADFFKYAHRNVVKASIRDFVNKSQANAGNMLKVATVAERSLFSKDAEYWSDEVYVEFAKPLAACKQLPNDVRNRLKGQLERINGNQVGAVLDFEYTAADGTRHRLSELTGKSFIVLFLDDSADSSIGRVRLSTDVALNALLESGEATLVCITLCDYSTAWSEQAATYNPLWVAGCNRQLADKIDLRGIPSCYVLDGERKIANKQLSVESLKAVVSPY